MGGCCLGIDDNITAITIVALGTSLPDMFASMTAAREDDWADASIVNVTGSNSVNVFLGIGVPWMMCAVYWQTAKDSADWEARYGHMPEFSPGQFVVIADNLGFSVSVFTSLALISGVGMRFKRVITGGELGGPAWINYSLALFMIFMWFMYVGMSILYQTDAKTAETLQTVVLILAMVFLAFGVVFEVMVMIGVVKEKIVEPPEPEEAEEEEAEEEVEETENEEAIEGNGDAVGELE